VREETRMRIVRYSGMGMRPPEFLKAGDVMELSIAGLGTQRHRVVAEQQR